MTVANDANVYLPPVVAIPSALEITNITQSNPMVVTVSANTDQSDTYIAGQTVKLTVPVTYKMWQANGLTATIISVTSTTLTLNVNSLGFDAFTIPSNTDLIPSLSPSGSRNLEYSNLTNQVPFQSLNNIGN